MAVRLHVELGRITEIETAYFRPGGGGPNDIPGMDARREPEAIWLGSSVPHHLNSAWGGLSGR